MQNPNVNSTSPSSRCWLVGCALSLLLIVSETAFVVAQPAPAAVASPKEIIEQAIKLKSAARAAFQDANPNKAREHLQALLQLYRQYQSDAHDLSEQRQWSQQLCEVAREYLRGGQLNEAGQLLGEVADLKARSSGEGDAALATSAAGLYRRLVGLNADERFEWLHNWTMPTVERRTVRVLTSITPTDPPSAVFARALGERPRRDSFAVPAIGGVHGLFNSAWELVTAADEASHLRKLGAEVSQLVEGDVANSRYLELLIKIAETTREDEQFRGELRDYLLQEADAAEAPDNTQLVIAAACLTRGWLQTLSEDILRDGIDESYDRSSPVMRPFLRTAHAIAIRQRYQVSSDGNESLRHWIPSSVLETKRHAQGASRSVWFAHEDHLMHLAGPRSDYLFLKYPLTGEFEFSCDAQIGGPGGTDGCVGYGGLGYELWGAEQLLKVWDASHSLVAEVSRPFARTASLPTFNKFSLKSTADGVTCSCNGHPIWTDATSGASSPWVALRSYGAAAPVFRNLKLTGSPTVPREVRMSTGDSLRGWAASYYGERIATEELDETADWCFSDGVIYGAKRDIEDVNLRQSRLYYLRPLLNQESISYEFQYQPGHLEVHPSVGRVAFLLEPGGVRLHWMTDEDDEWTGLAEDNTVVEPLNRRGPKPLPLLTGAWNRITIDLERDTLTLSLNDTTIYAHAMEPQDERTFGFYHDQHETKARVRNVVMRGAWPERLTEEQLSNLAANSALDSIASEKHALHAIFGESNIAANVLEVRRLAAELAPEARYRFLSSWVLPGEDHPGLRLTGAFAPTNPAPVLQRLSGDNAARSSRSRLLVGGDLVAPAFDLVNVARQLGSLDELRLRVDQFQAPANSYEQRARLALLFLIDIARDDSDAAKTHCAQLIDLVREGTHVEVLERWPETIALAQGVNYAPTREHVSEFLYLLRNMYRSDTRGWRTQGSRNWDHWYFSQLGAFEYLRSRSASPDRFTAAPRLTNWAPVTYTTARTCGEGLPRPHWQVDNERVVKLGGHEQDYLHYRIPLAGDYEVECDLTSAAWRTMELMVGGTWVGPWWNRKAYVFGDFRDQQPLQDLAVPLAGQKNEWARYRAVVRDGVCTTYFNGRQFHTQPLTEGSEPWLAIRATARSNGAVRDLRISGNPIIPAKINLAMTPELHGWLPYHDDSIGPNGDWRPLDQSSAGGGIVGMKEPALAETFKESLLRYHRPMLEDGVIEYEFYYRDGEIHAHPALDRLGFMLQADGVRVHWITDGPWDRTGLAADNLHDEPDNRRRQAVLPLKTDQWNQMRLSLTGDIVDLTLNGKLIYQRELEPTNQRTFGLFHYADQTETRARNIVWSGDWPRKLPAIAQQELASQGTELLDESLADLTAVFHHDFTARGMPMDLFGVTAGSVEHFSAQPDGLRVTRPGGPGHHGSSIAPHLTLQGDFDIMAEFEQFAPDPSEGGSGGVFLHVLLNDPGSSECLVFRRDFWHPTEPRPIVQAAYNTRKVGGVKRDKLPDMTSEATAGRLRLSRRGETVYFLFAENDSLNFRLVGTQVRTKDDVNSVRLMADTFQDGLTKVVWKNLTVRANGLAGLALLDENNVLAKLNRERDELPQRFEFDFANGEVTDDGFMFWGAAAPLSEETGVRVIAPGADEWTSFGLAPRIGVVGDFDIAATLNVVDLAKPKVGLHTGFYLQIRFPDAAQSQANLILVQQADGSPDVTAQLANVDAGGNWVFRRVRLAKVESIEVLRLARRGKHLSFIYRQKESHLDQILAETEIGDIPIATAGVRLQLHTGGAERQSEVLLKQLRVYAKEIDPLPAIFRR